MLTRQIEYVATADQSTYQLAGGHAPAGRFACSCLLVRENGCVALLSEFKRGTVGCVPGLQTALGGEALGTRLGVDSNSTLQERCERVTGFEPV
jgi:hypothetical protein